MAKIKDLFDKKISDFLKKNNINYSELKGKTSQLALMLSSNFLSKYYYSFLGQDRIDEKMEDFALMMKDPIVYNAAEMFVDDATQYSPITQKRVWPSMKSKKQQKILEDLFGNLDIDESCWLHYMKLCVFGNIPIRLNYKNDDFTGGIDSIEVEENFFRYIPIELNGVLIKWIDKYNDELLEPFEVIFGRINLLVDYNFTDNYYNMKIGNDYDQEKKNLKNTFIYGTSMFDNVRRTWRQLKLLEDNMILTRLDRSPVIRIYKVVTEGMNAETATDMMEFYTSLLATDDRRLSVDDDLLKQTNGQAGYGKNVMLPVSDKGDINVDEFGGQADVTGIVDVEYFRQKFYAGLKIPPEYLGLESNRGLSIGDNSLLRKEIQYARRVKKLQFAGINMYKDIAYYHLLSLREEIDYSDINVLMNVVSTAEDEEFKNALDTSLSNATSFIDLINDVKDFVKDNNADEKSRDYLMDYLTTRILNMNDFNWNEFLNGILKSSEEETEMFESRKLFLNSNVMKNMKTLFNDNDIKNRIPKYNFNKNLKYIKNTFNNENKRYILENVKEKYNIDDVKHIRKILEQTEAFDISIFGLKTEKKDLDFVKYDLNVLENEKVKIKDIIFLEYILDVKDIFNKNSKKITIYKLEDKYYCNYVNMCKLFERKLNKTDINIEVIDMKSKKLKNS